MTDKPERISMRVASWSTNEPQPDGWCLNLADQAVTCKVGGLVFNYGIEEGLRQYTSAIRADLATPAPREDGYSAGVRAALPAMERCLSRLDDLPVKHPQQASDKAAFRAALRALAGQPPV